MKKSLLSLVLILVVFVFALKAQQQQVSSTTISIISTGESEWVYIEDENDVVIDSVLVQLSHDDAEQENDEIDALNDDDIDFGWEGAPDDQNILNAGLRFQNVQIPQGATIDSAYLILTSHEPKSAEDVAIITIVAEATDNAETFTEDALITDREQTSATVTWTIDEEWGLWTVHHSADFAAVVQEVVNRPGWEAGNAIAIMLLGSDEQGASEVENAREVEAFENIADPADGGDGANHPERVPKLFIQYSDATSVDAVSQAVSFNIYPNPVAGQSVNVDLDNNTQTIINVYNITGKLVKTTTTASSRLSINVAELSKGIYLMQVQNSNGTYTKKFVVK